MSAISRSDEIVLAYRHLYRTGLRSIHYSKPARYTLRDRLRNEFRKRNHNDFDATRIRNTVEFLRLAAVAPSLEHRMLRSLLLTWYYDKNLYPQRQSDRQLYAKVPQSEVELQATAREQYQHIVRMLNESMGMCIPP